MTRRNRSNPASALLLLTIAALTSCTSPESKREPRLEARAEAADSAVSPDSVQQDRSRERERTNNWINSRPRKEPASEAPDATPARAGADADERSRIESWTESAEAALDVIVAFRGEAWDRVVREAQAGNAQWARERVIEELLKYHDDPPSYFASEPAFLANTVPFETRIEWEVIGHVRENDNEIRFSKWFGAKRYWVREKRD